MERRLAAILAADVVGYTRLMGADEAGTLQRLTELRQQNLEPLIAEHHGRIFKLIGDGLLVEFASVVDALACAQAWQDCVASHQAAVDEERRLTFRIGVNLGDVIVEGDDIYGDGVNIAARIESLAEPGGVYLSGDAHRHAKGKLDIGFDDLGDHDLKNVAEPVQVYRVSADHLAAASAPAKPAALPLPDKPSIAVLPFTNMSGDPEQEYFSDGITEDIITELSRIGDLFVIARNSSFSYKGKSLKVQEIGRDLGVAHLVEGSVRKAGNRVRVTAQLVEATTGNHVWAERYDRELDDIFAVQDDVTEQITEALQSRLQRPAEVRSERQTPQSIEAYDCILRAIEYSQRVTVEANAEVRVLCERALALDPDYAEAYTRLANTYVQEWNQGWKQHPEETLDRAEALALKATEINSGLAFAHAILEHLYLWKKEHDKAIASGERALALDPNDSDTHAIHAMTLSWAGRPVEALSAVEKAMRLNPHHPHWYHFVHGLAFFEAQRLDEALAAFRRGVARSPQFMPNHFYLAVTYADQERNSEARAEAAELIRLNPAMTLNSAQRLLPYRDRSRLEHCLNGLQEAGLPE